MNQFVQEIVNAAALGSIYALLALGISLIFGIMRLLNFAHGDLMTIAAYTMFVMGVIWWPVFMLVAVAVTVGAALLIERVAFRPVRSADESTLLITSFALSYLIQNVAVLTFSSRVRGVYVPPQALNDAVTIFGVRVAVVDIVTTVVAVVLMVVLAAFLKNTQLGLRMRASAEDFSMSRALGVSANRVVATAFAVSGALAAVAGILYIAKTGTVTPAIGSGPLVIAFVAVILGGMGSLGGSVLGAYLIATLTVILQSSLPIEQRPYRDAFLFLLVFIVLVFRPKGLIVIKSARTRV